MVGDIDISSLYLEPRDVSDDYGDCSYDKDINILKDLSDKNLLGFGGCVKDGVIAKRRDSYAEWDVTMDINGKLITAPVIVVRTKEGYRIRNFRV